MPFSSFSPLEFIEPLLLFGNGAWLPLIVPRGARFLNYTLQGAGGNGGNGFSGAAGSPRGGGGGGGTGGLIVGQLPLSLMPSVLYIKLGVPLTGSYLAIRPDILNQHMIASAGSGGNGGNGTAAAAGAAGAIGSGNGQDGVGYTYGPHTRINGGAGVAGGAHTGAAGGTVLSNNVSSMVTGGAGGSGVTATDFNGGPINFQPNTNGYWPFNNYEVAVAPGGRGANGISRFYPYPVFTGGGGGATANNGVGGAGGDAAPGSGGGGGGGGVTGGLGGKGGVAFALLLWS